MKVASSIRTLADLKGRTVAVQTDTPVEKALKEGGEKAALGATFKGIVVTPNYNNAVMELDAGAVDAIAMDMGVALKKLADCPGQFRILDEAVMHEFYGIGFKKGNVALRDQVTETLREMVADGTAAKISAPRFRAPRTSHAADCACLPSRTTSIPGHWRRSAPWQDPPRRHGRASARPQAT